MTNGEKIKAVFPDCKDWKAKIEENNEEVYEVHFVQLPNSITINKYEESWWNAETTKNDLGVDECVSKQAVLNKIFKFSATDGRGVSVTGLWKEVNKLPLVTPIRPKGHWIWCGGSHKCSNCEEYTCFSHKELLKYCPNCGAKMEEVEE